MGRPLRAVPGTRPRGPSSRPASRHRYKFHRPHKLHYYFVMASITMAVVVCTLNTIAYATRRLDLADVAFAAILVAALTIFCTFFLGFFMLMNGNIPAKRLKYLIPHGAVGTLSPLLYTLNIAAALDGLGTQPVGIVSLATSYASFALLGIQFAMGKAVVRPDPLRLLRGRGTHMLDL